MNLDDFYIETKYLPKKISFSTYLTQSIFATSLFGNTAVVCGKPQALMSRVILKWPAVTQAETTSGYRENLKFSTEPRALAHVRFSTSKQFRLQPPRCNTLYILSTARVDAEDIRIITSNMQAYSRIIVLVKS